jgi:excinuclease ABC subunit C
MSKGENRNAGEEWFHRLNQQSITLEKHSPLMHYLQRLRDEAHRFAITSHRIRRSKNVFEK